MARARPVSSATSKEASDWLGVRLAEERKKVEAAEAKLQQYREQNDAIVGGETARHKPELLSAHVQGKGATVRTRDSWRTG